MSNTHKRMHTIGKSVSALPEYYLHQLMYHSELHGYHEPHNFWQRRFGSCDAKRRAPLQAHGQVGCIWLVPHVAVHIM